MEFTGERYLPDNFKLVDEISDNHLKRYEFALDFINELSVVDIACGEGYGSDLLATKAKKVVGIDIDKETIEFANQKYKRENLFFLNGSVSKIDLPDSSVDVLVSFETIEHVDERTQNIFYKEIIRVLKSSGILIISTPDKDIYGEGHNSFHVREMNLKQFSEQLMSFFDNVDFFGQDIHLYKNKFTLLILRIFHTLIKLDKFKIRHKIFSKNIRSEVDLKLRKSSIEKDNKINHYPIKIKDGETASYLIAVCRNKR